VPNRREEALKAIDHVLERLASQGVSPQGPLLNGLAVRQLAATLDYAKEQVTAIQEVKRRRKTKGDS
jgi:hypothetical protein